MSDYEQAYRDLRAGVEALVDRMLCPWDRGAVERLLASSAPATASEGATEPDHEFLPVNGHPDDDECTHRADGTDATYCGKTRAEHDEPEHHPNCYQSTGEIPADLPDDLCDCRVLRMIDAATGVTSSDGDRGLSDQELRDVRAAFERDKWAGEFNSLPTAFERILAARTDQPEGVARVEWGHRYPDGSLIPDSSEAVAKSRAAISSARGGEPLVLVRRTVTPWEVVDDE